MTEQTESKQIEEKQKETAQAENTFHTEKKKTNSVWLFVRGIAFVLVGILLLGQVQQILIRKNYYPVFENIYPTVNGIDAVEKNHVDVLFLGSSHIEYGISPMQIYEDTGIITYNMGTAKQQVPNSYYLLKRVLKKQSPKVVVMDMSPAFLKNTDNAAWRYLLDSMKLDFNKLDMLFNGYRKAKNSDGFFAGLFPIIKYHSRWDDLTKEDFLPAKEGFYYSAGQYVRALNQPTDVTLEQVDQDAKTVQDKEYTTKINQKNVEYYEKIRDLCNENGAELLLVKMPVRALPSEYHSAWTKDRYEASKELAKELGVSYYDFQYDTDLGIDYQHETVDEGHHLNMFGAKKATNAMESYLLTHYDLEKRTSSVYDEGLNVYHKVWEIALLHSKEDAASYFEELSKKQENYILVIGAKDGQLAKQGDETKGYLKRLGLLQTDSDLKKKLYGAILLGKEVTFESFEDETKIANEFTVADSVYTLMVNQTSTSISVEGKNQFLEEKGILLVVIDRETGVAVDSITLSTKEDGTCEFEREALDGDERFQLYEDTISHQ